MILHSKPSPLFGRGRCVVGPGRNPGHPPKEEEKEKEKKEEFLTEEDFKL